MNTVRVVFWRCLSAPWWPLVLAVAAVLLAAGSATTLRADAADAGPLDAAATSWLQLPWTLALFFVGATAIECWPLFATHRPGAALVQRLERGPLAGCGAATLGALAAAAVWLTGLGLLLPALLGGVPPAAAFRELSPLAGRTLDEHRAELLFSGPGDHGAELWLRPLAMLPMATPESTVLQVLVDGNPVHREPIRIDNTGQLVRVPVDQPMSHVTIRRTDGNLPLLFPPGSVQVRGAATWPGWCNALFAAWSLLLGLGLAMAVVNMTAPGAGLGVQLLLFASALVLPAVAGFGPASLSTVAALRGRWLPAEPLFVPIVSFLAAAGAAMIVAMLLRRGVRS